MNLSFKSSDQVLVRGRDRAGWSASSKAESEGRKAARQSSFSPEVDCAGRLGVTHSQAAWRTI